MFSSIQTKQALLKFYLYDPGDSTSLFPLHMYRLILGLHIELATLYSYNLVIALFRNASLQSNYDAEYSDFFLSAYIYLCGFVIGSKRSKYTVLSWGKKVKRFAYI